MKIQTQRILILIPLLIFIHILVIRISKPIFFEEMIGYPFFISKGLFMHRDFIAMYQPLLPYLFAYIYEIFGFSYHTASAIWLVLLICTDLTLITVTFLLHRSVRSVIVVFLFYVLWHPVVEGRLLWFETLATPFVLVSFWLFTDWIRHPKKTLLFAGLFSGFAFCVKQQYAIFLFIQSLIVIMLVIRKKQSLRPLRQLLIAPIAIQCAIILWMTVHGMLNPYLYWMFIAPIFSFSSNNSFILRPSLFEMTRVLPLFAVPVTLVTLNILRRSREHTWMEHVYWFCTLIVSLFLIFPRFAFFHMQTALSFAAIGCWSSTDFQIRSTRKLYVYLGIIICITLGILTYKSQKYYYVVGQKSVQAFDEGSLNRLRRSIQKHIHDEPFFSLENKHFVYALMNATPEILPVAQLIPGLVELSVQQKIITELSKSSVRYVIDFPSGNNGNRTNTSMPELVQKYIQNNFTEFYSDAPNSDMRILVRK